jgi:ribose 5-phosphate isomerase B
MTSREQIRAKVKTVVYRTLGREMPAEPARRRELVGEHDLRELPAGAEFKIPAGALVTPLARQVAMDRGVRLVPDASKATGMASGRPLMGGTGHEAIAIGADHGGFALKESLKEFLQSMGRQVVDCGTFGAEAVDYPDFALAVAELVAQRRVSRGILVDGAGIGSCMAANKVPGVRAAMCYDQSTAVNSREHNDANVLTLGAGMIGLGLAKQIVKTWLETPFGGGRHARRVDKIAEIERRYSRKG